MATRLFPTKGFNSKAGTSRLKRVIDGLVLLFECANKDGCVEGYMMYTSFCSLLCLLLTLANFVLDNV